MTNLAKRLLDALLYVIATMLLALIVFALDSCSSPKEVQVKVTAKAAFDKHEGIFWLSQQSPVTDFNHVYDSITLMITNLAGTTPQRILGNNKPEFTFGISEGTYQFFMSTKDPRPIESYLHFYAAADNQTVPPNGITLNMNSETEQSLLLIDKNGISGVPTITVQGKMGLMNISPNYYYAYVVDKNQGVKISASISGQVIDMVVAMKAKNIYVLKVASAGVGITEPFINVIKV